MACTPFCPTRSSVSTYSLISQLTEASCNFVRPLAPGLSRSSALVLRVTDTSLTQLPPGLLRFMDNRLTVLDIRRNRLTQLSPSVLQAVGQQRTAKGNHRFSFTSKSSEKRPGFDAGILSDGILLDDNPWICSCELTWLSDWLRRWAKDMRRSHMLEPALVSAMTDGSCVPSHDPHFDSKGVPLIELRPNLFACNLPSLASASSIHYVALICVPLLIVVSTAAPLLTSF